jgi:farnesyl diphosphate synthase
MDAKNSPFLTRLDAVAAETETLLGQLLAAKPIDAELARPARLIEAMRYSSLGGGKRFRPFLVVESAALFGVPRHRALMAGAALECVLFAGA